ncbi:putative ABC transporter ATP-binding protein [Companilactobacillus paralimentarius]
MVLDDATSAVDQATNAQIKKNLQKLRHNKTTLIISQRVTNVMNCDEIIVLEDGKLTAQGTHAELLQKSNFYRDLIQTQLGDVDFDA